MKTIPINHSVFYARLTEYVMIHHPQRIKETDFITERAAAAARVFESSSIAGMSVEEAMAEADHTLFEGLLFSPFQLVREVVITEFDYTENDDELDEFTLQMLDNVQPLIAAHQPDDHFQGSTEYTELYNEIKESINQYLVRNGIQ